MNASLDIMVIRKSKSCPHARRKALWIEICWLNLQCLGAYTLLVILSGDFRARNVYLSHKPDSKASTAIHIRILVYRLMLFSVIIGYIQFAVV